MEDSSCFAIKRTKNQIFWTVLWYIDRPSVNHCEFEHAVEILSFQQKSTNVSHCIFSMKRKNNIPITCSYCSDSSSKVRQVNQIEDSLTSQSLLWTKGKLIQLRPIVSSPIAIELALICIIQQNRTATNVADLQW